MPSKSPAQHRFMEAAAHNARFAKSAKIPQKVAQEFVSADRGHPGRLEKLKQRK